MELTMESVEKKDETPANDPVKKGTILIMEDQRGFRRVYRDVLEQDGYTVLEGTNGEEGRALIILSLLFKELAAECERVAGARFERG